MINDDQPITRRESIRKLLKLSGCLMMAGTVIRPSQFATAAQATPPKRGFIVEGIGRTDNYDVKELTRKTFEAAGGIKQFSKFAAMGMDANRGAEITEGLLGAMGGRGGGVKDALGITQYGVKFGMAPEQQMGLAGALTL